jgi:hypothetical protein
MATTNAAATLGPTGGGSTVSSRLLGSELRHIVGGREPGNPSREVTAVNGRNAVNGIATPKAAPGSLQFGTIAPARGNAVRPDVTKGGSERCGLRTA